MITISLSLRAGSVSRTHREAKTGGGSAQAPTQKVGNPARLGRNETNWHAQLYMNQVDERLLAKRTGTRKAIVFCRLNRISRENFVRRHASRIRFRIGCQETKANPRGLSQKLSIAYIDSSKSKAKLFILPDIMGLGDTCALFWSQNAQTYTAETKLGQTMA